MKKLVVALSAIALVAACDSSPRPKRSLNDPAVQKLYALPLPEFYGTFDVAQKLAAACPRYSYDAALRTVLHERRTKESGDSLAAIRARDGVVLMRDVLTREFQARHGVTVGTEDICPALDAEYDSGSALSAPLVRGRR